MLEIKDINLKFGDSLGEKDYIEPLTILLDSLKKEGILAEADLRNEKISYKIREHSNRKVPIILAIGNNEKKDGTVSIRRIGSTETEVVDLKEAIKQITKENLIHN